MTNIKGLDAAIRFAVLENAVKFKGKANPKAVIGNVIKACPAAKDDMKTTATEIAKIVSEINALEPDAQKAALLEIKPDYFEEQHAAKEQRKQERSELPELPGAVMEEVVTRIPPEPSKYNHLGHAMSFLINYLYAKRYKGKCLLRFDDTNPEKESQEFVDAMEHDVLEYLGIEPDGVSFASDHMPRLYNAAAELVKRGEVFTCTCPSKEMSKLRRDMKPCACRDKDTETVSREWMEMLEGKHEEGFIVLRLKIDMEHKNAVMRDPVIMRLCLTPHYRQGDEYKVWPLYDFENALADSWDEMTHVLRSNEFDTRIELHNYIKDLFKLPKQVFVHYGRYAVEGLSTQGRVIREKIESGDMIGWDDPRLLTLRALRRRGIVREAYYELAQQIGLSKTQTNLDFCVIAAINRHILDEQASRYFFVQEPVKIVVDDWPADLKAVELKLHPHHNRGGRHFDLDGEFFIAKKDYDKIIDGKVFRLIDTINLQYDKKTEKFVVHSQGIDDFKKLSKEDKHGFIHFLPANMGLVKARLFMPEATYIEGLCEPTVEQLRAGAHVQFERQCFARLDSIDIDEANTDENSDPDVEAFKTYTFWYTHE